MNTTKQKNPVPIDVDFLYRRYGPMVLRRCRMLLRDEYQAEDAMQDVFVQVLSHRGRLDSSYPSSLLYTIATHTCLNRLRSNSRRRDFPNDGLIGNMPGRGKTEEEAVDRMLVEQLFTGERQDTRRIAELRHVEGLSWGETAQRIGLSISGTRKRFRGLQRRSLAAMSA